MNAGQYEGILGRLDAILAKMPAAPVEDPGTWSRVGGEFVYSRKPAPPRTAPVADPPHTGVACRQSLAAMLRMLDSWIDGARENHRAVGHRNENTGEECWRTFAPDDIRRMVNDVAQELGLAGFPAPTTPEEDKS